MAQSSYQVIMGRDTDIKVKVQTRGRLTQPWGNCVRQEYLDHAVSRSGKPITYTKDACLDECYEIQLKQTCGCRDITTMGLMDTRYSDVIYCGDIKMGLEYLIRNMTCMTNIRNTFEMICQKNCPVECKTIEFSLTSSDAQWPDPVQTASFYRSFMEGNAIQDTFLEMYGYNTSNMFNETSPLHLYNLYKFILKHFTKVNIFFPSDTYFVLEENAKSTFSQAISQVASILNFWTGVTVLVFVEIVDCILKICHQSGCLGWNKKEITFSADNNKSEKTVETTNLG